MKKITMICMAALLLLAASCKKEKEENNEPAGDEGTFRVETEVHSGDGKTHLDGGSVVWDSGDAIKVINGNGASLVFSFSKYAEEGDHTVAEFTAENLPAGFYTPNYTGYYPSDFNPSSYSMPQTQTYSANGFVAGANPMIATNEPQKLLHFKNLCGVLKLQLWSKEEVKVEKIIVRSKKSGEKLWGTGSVNTDGVFTITSGGSNDIELYCNPEVTLSTNAAAPSTFFIVLPVGTLSEGFEVEVIDKDSHGNWTIETTKNNTIARSRIRQMPVCTVKIGVQLYANGPYWATCNLGATSPTRYGDYYAFGETEPYYTSLTWNLGGTSATAVDWKTGKENGYWWPSYPSNENNTDGPNSGDPNFIEPFTFVNGNDLKTDNDAAYQHYNVPGYELNEGIWRIPTASEFSNMFSNTDHEYSSNYKGTGIAGWLYKGRGAYTGRSIFLPLAGYFDGKDFGSGEGDYTTATRRSDKIAYRIHYYIDKTDDSWQDKLHRYYGETIRPIKVNN